MSIVVRSIVFNTLFYINLFAHLIGIQQVRKINAGRSPDTVKAPSARVHIQQLKLSISMISLKLDLDQAVVIDVFQKAK